MHRVKQNQTEVNMITEVKEKKSGKRSKGSSEQENARFSAKLAELRKQKHITQKELAERISREGDRLFGREAITDRAVSKWETGASLPDAQQFISICHILGVTDVLHTFRGIANSSDPFAGLNKLGRERAAEYVGMLGENPHFSLNEPSRQPIRQIPLYDLPASAGTGVFLDGSGYTMIDADGYAASAANFAVRISGDSMLPLFEDGQIVYVRQQQELASGDIGIFILNGEAYCKMLNTDNGVSLVSLNPKYKPIIPSEGSDLRIVGRVVG